MFRFHEEGRRAKTVASAVVSVEMIGEVTLEGSEPRFEGGPAKNRNDVRNLFVR